MITYYTQDIMNDALDLIGQRYTEALGARPDGRRGTQSETERYGSTPGYTRLGNHLREHRSHLQEYRAGRRGATIDKVARWIAIHNDQCPGYPIRLVIDDVGARVEPMAPSDPGTPEVHP